MGTSKLALYNEALRRVGERKLASLTENREPRHLLDDAYTDAVDYVLEQGLWNFAMRTSRLDASASVTPPFGYAYAFEKPTDWKRTAALSADEYFATPLLQYEDEQAYWFADFDEIYVRYVSSDSSYGGDLSLWPATFTRYAATYLATQLPTLHGSATRTEALEKLAKRQLMDAKSKDAMNEPTRFPPTGGWASARLGRGGADRGRRTRLTG